MASVLDQIPGFVKGAGLGLGATALTAIVAMSSSKDLKPLVSHPLFWIFGPGVGAVAFSWNEWGRREGSTSTTTSGSTSHSLLPTTSSRSTSNHFQGHFSTEEVGSEVHPVYAQTTEGIRQHVLHFPPGSKEFSEELKNGKEFLGHVATVYHPVLPPTTSSAEVPGGGWQTVTTTHGEFDDHRSATALPPATQQAINAQPKTPVPAEDLQPLPSTEDDWTAKWAAISATAPEEDQEALQPIGSNGSSDGDDYWGE